jgi:hypothetical protein
VYYKTFAFVRGEPYVAFFAVVVLYYVVLILVRKRFFTVHALLLGCALGCAALSRQWGMFLFPAVGLFGAVQWIRCPGDRLASGIASGNGHGASHDWPTGATATDREAGTGGVTAA